MKVRKILHEEIKHQSKNTQVLFRKIKLVSSQNYKIISSQKYYQGYKSSVSIGGVVGYFET